MGGGWGVLVRGGDGGGVFVVEVKWECGWWGELGFVRGVDGRWWEVEWERW